MSSEWKIARSAALYHERCICGAEFTMSLNVEGGEAAVSFQEGTPSGELQAWQERHAIVCEPMQRQIAPRLERERRWQEETLAKNAAKKAKAAARKAAKQDDGADRTKFSVT